jgi:hypothetical protein
MGLNYPTGALLAWAVRNRGLSANRVVTIGRLEVNMSASQQQRIQSFLASGQSVATHAGASADELLSAWCHSASVESLDVSDYQGASIVHDLNYPVPEELTDRYDLLVDGGSLEHIFNVPVALANYKRMVRPGGWLLVATTANNYMGHGFYQFSPELFYSYFSRENGYSIEHVGLALHPFPSSSLSDRCELYEVADPRTVKTRVGLVSGTPALLLVLAKRLSATDATCDSVMQSDYQSLHEVAAIGDSGSTAKQAESENHRRMIARWLPACLVRYLRGLNERRWYSIHNRRAFRKHTLENWD